MGRGIEESIVTTVDESSQSAELDDWPTAGHDLVQAARDGPAGYGGQSPALLLAATGSAPRADARGPRVHRAAGGWPVGATWIGSTTDVSDADPLTIDDIRLVPVPLTGGAGGRLLRGLLERRDLAALPLCPAAEPVPASALGPVRHGQRALRRGGRRAWRPGTTSCGCTTTSCCSCRRCSARAPPRRAHRLLPPHPVPAVELFRMLPWRREILAGCSAPTSSASTRRRDARTSATRAARCSALGGTDGDAVDADGRDGAARRVPDRHRRRARSTSSPHDRASPAARRALREQRGDGGAHRSSASTGSTTPRASRAAARVRASCCGDAELRRRGACSSRSRCRRASTCATYRELRQRDRASWSAASTAVRRRTRAPRALPAPRARRDGAGGAVPRRRRDARDAAARRHEPRRQGVRRLPQSTSTACSCSASSPAPPATLDRRRSSTRTICPSVAAGIFHAVTVTGRGPERMRRMRTAVMAESPELWGDDLPEAGRRAATIERRGPR